MFKQITVLQSMIALFIVGGIAGCAGNAISSPANLSDDRILKLMGQPQNQFYTYWAGESHWKLTKDGSSNISFGHLHYARNFDERTSWPLLQHCLLKNSRLLKRPLLLVPLFDSESPQTVLNALYYYSKLAEKLKTGAQDDAPVLAQGLRKLVYNHPDVRVRWKALDILTDLEWLTIADVNQALSDPSDSVRLTASTYLNGHIKSISQCERKLRFADFPEDRAFSRIRKEIVPVILKHINDNHYNVRFECYQALKTVLGYSAPPQAPRFPVNLPPEIDWMRESWWKCNETQKQLQEWWDTHCETVAD